MGSIVISTPSVIINNEVILIKPNSLKYTSGLGEFKVRTESAGGGEVQTVAAKDVSTQIGKLSFSLEPTTENANLVRGWKSNFNNNAIEVVDTDSGFTGTFTNAVLVNDPEMALSSDGEISVEWQSDPAS
jgi:hypothetical protein